MSDNEFDEFWTPRKPTKADIYIRIGALVLIFSLLLYIFNAVT